MRRRRRVRKTAPARADIDRIALWIAQSSGSVHAGLKWMDSLDEKFLKLADAPGTGTRHPDVHPHVLSSPFGNYVIYFRVRADSISILRVIHGARDEGAASSV